MTNADSVDATGKRVGIYARVSTTGQDLDGQVDRCRRWAEGQGHEVAGIYTEKVSARSSDRPAQLSLMGEAMGRRVQVVAVAKVDRWARSMSHLTASVEKLANRGIQFVAVDQGLHVVPGDPTSELILGVLGAVGQWEASIISERTREALARKKEAGVKLGRPAKQCEVCGSDRPKRLRAKVSGESRAVCRQCKDLDPAKRRDMFDGEGSG